MREHGVGARHSVKLSRFRALLNRSSAIVDRAVTTHRNYPGYSSRQPVTMNPRNGPFTGERWRFSS